MSDEALERLVRVETKLDVIVERLPDHETRIRTLEALRWKVYGAAVVLGGVASVLMRLVMR